VSLYHLHMKPVKAGKSAAKKHDYISRNGEYRERIPDEVSYQEHANLPSFAQGDPRAFFEASDEYERKNGVRAREIEFALPVELSADQRHRLASDFAHRLASMIGAEKGGALPFSLAVHNNPRNPHCHLLVCERPTTEHSRQLDEKGFFGRKNSKVNFFREDSIQNLREVREVWQNLQNEHLAQRGHSARVSALSYADQGIDKQAGVHVGYAGHAFARGRITKRAEYIFSSGDKDKAQNFIESTKKAYAGHEKPLFEKAKAKAQKAIHALPSYKNERDFLYCHKSYKAAATLNKSAYAKLQERNKKAREAKAEATKPPSGRLAEALAVGFANIFLRPFTGVTYVTSAELARIAQLEAREAYRAQQQAKKQLQGVKAKIEAHYGKPPGLVVKEVHDLKAKLKSELKEKAGDINMRIEVLDDLLAQVEALKTREQIQAAKPELQAIKADWRTPARYTIAADREAVETWAKRHGLEIKGDQITRPGGRELIGSYSEKTHEITITRPGDDALVINDADALQLKKAEVPRTQGRAFKAFERVADVTKDKDLQAEAKHQAARIAAEVAEPKRERQRSAGLGL